MPIKPLMLMLQTIVDEIENSSKGTKRMGVSAVLTFFIEEKISRVVRDTKNGFPSLNYMKVSSIQCVKVGRYQTYTITHQLHFFGIRGFGLAIASYCQP